MVDRIVLDHDLANTKAAEPVRHTDNMAYPPWVDPILLPAPL